MVTNANESVGTQQGASKLPRSQSNQRFTGSHVSVDGTGLPFPRLTDPNKVTGHLHRSGSISPRFITRVCFRKTNQDQVVFHSRLAFTRTSVNLEQKGVTSVLSPLGWETKGRHRVAFVALAL